jgi:DNA-binding NarL/FixJ family response regulator
MILTVTADNQTVVDAVRASACGYLAKDTQTEELICAIDAAARSQPPLSPHATAVALDQCARTRTIPTLWRPIPL